MLVVGTGAVASFLIPLLRGAGHEIQVFGSPSLRLSALASLGSVAVSDPAAVGQHEDWLVVCKTWQNVDKVELLRGAPPPRRILVLQNGMDPEAAWLAPGVIVERGLSTYGVASDGPGTARGGETGEITVPHGSAWASALSQAGLAVRQCHDMSTAIWWKLVVNASLNVVAALEDLHNGEVLERPQACLRASMAAREVAGLARALQVPLGDRDGAQEMQRVARATSGNICSTLADLRAGRTTEYDSINGVLLDRARARGWSLPVLEELDQQFALVRSRIPPLLVAS